MKMLIWSYRKTSFNLAQGYHLSHRSVSLLMYACSLYDVYLIGDLLCMRALSILWQKNAQNCLLVVVLCLCNIQWIRADVTRYLNYQKYLFRNSFLITVNVSRLAIVNAKTGAEIPRKDNRILIRLIEEWFWFQFAFYSYKRKKKCFLKMPGVGISHTVIGIKMSSKANTTVWYNVDILHAKQPLSVVFFMGFRAR